MKTEKDLHNYLRKQCKLHRILFFKTVAEGQRGFPDCTLISDNSLTVFVELKSPAGTGHLSALQKSTINKMLDKGANVFVLDSKQGVDDLIDIIVADRKKPGRARL